MYILKKCEATVKFAYVQGRPDCSARPCAKVEQAFGLEVWQPQLQLVKHPPGHRIASRQPGSCVAHRLCLVVRHCVRRSACAGCFSVCIRGSIVNGYYLDGHYATAGYWIKGRILN